MKIFSRKRLFLCLFSGIQKGIYNITDVSPMQRSEKKGRLAVQCKESRIKETESAQIH